MGLQKNCGSDVSKNSFKAGRRNQFIFNLKTDLMTLLIDFSTSYNPTILIEQNENSNEILSRS